MSSPGYIPPPNYTQFPNVLLDRIADFSHPEWKVVCLLVRETFGYHRNEKRLSIGQMVKRTGVSEQSVRNAIRSLIELGYLTRRPEGDSWSYALRVGTSEAPPTSLVPPLGDVPPTSPRPPHLLDPPRDRGDPLHLLDPHISCTPQEIDPFLIKDRSTTEKERKESTPLTPHADPTPSGGIVDEGSRKKNPNADTDDNSTALSAEDAAVLERLARLSATG